MVPETPPTAEGDLAQTPFAHLAVYAMDRRLNGELFLFEQPEVVHAVCFERGQPVKIRMGNSYARLGGLLIEEGLVASDVVEGAVLTGGLLGDVLVLSGYVESEPLDRVILRQFEMRNLGFYDLPAETTYRYFDQSCSLKDWGGDPVRIDPLALLWRGVRAHGERSALFEPTLEKVKDIPLLLHPRATVANFELEEDAKLVVDVLSLDPTPLDDLLTIEGVSADVVRRLVYALTISRQFDLGRGTLPIGVEERSRSLAKVQLRSQVHRQGAAVDAPGDGERSVRARSVLGRAVIPRDDDASSLEEEGASQPGEIPPPPSAPTSAPDPAVATAAEDHHGGAEIEFGHAEIDESELLEAAASEVVASAEQRTPDEVAEESTRRLVSDTIKALPLDALLKLARDKIEDREPTMAQDVCEVGLKRLADQGDTERPAYAELVALKAWACSLEPHPDLKSLTVELDDLIRVRDALVLPRHVRGLLRKRLGDSPGAASDFRRVLELDPDHEVAKKELPSVAPGPIKRGDTGFLKRLFRR